MADFEIDTLVLIALFIDFQINWCLLRFQILLFLYLPVPHTHTHTHTTVSWCQKRTSGLYGARED